jgi:hypothetical protein
LATVEILRPSTDGPGAEAFVTAVVFAGIAFGIYRIAPRRYLRVGFAFGWPRLRLVGRMQKDLP